MKHSLGDLNNGDIDRHIVNHKLQDYSRTSREKHILNLENRELNKFDCAESTLTDST